ncbi:MAG: hypothetical protein OEY01_09445, partial [Desulfobulbaceae bacterium]|nr:hypothetical protein [Desulfobulbaceae bacterium]
MADDFYKGSSFSLRAQRKRSKRKGTPATCPPDGGDPVLLKIAESLKLARLWRTQTVKLFFQQFFRC